MQHNLSLSKRSHLLMKHNQFFCLTRSCQWCRSVKGREVAATEAVNTFWWLVEILFPLTENDTTLQLLLILDRQWHLEDFIVAHLKNSCGGRVTSRLISHLNAAIKITSSMKAFIDGTVFLLRKILFITSTKSNTFHHNTKIQFLPVSWIFIIRKLHIRTFEIHWYEIFLVLFIAFSINGCFTYWYAFSNDMKFGWLAVLIRSHNVGSCSIQHGKPGILAFCTDVLT